MHVVLIIIESFICDLHFVHVTLVAGWRKSVAGHSGIRRLKSLLDRFLQDT